MLTSGASLADKPEGYDAIADASDPVTLTDWVEVHLPGFLENFGRLSLPVFITTPNTVEELLRMRWMLWDFSGQKNHLLLSDRPCITTTGKDDPNFVVALPIGPWRAFMAVKTDRVASILRGYDPRTLLMRMNESAVANATCRAETCPEAARGTALSAPLAPRTGPPSRRSTIATASGSLDWIDATNRASTSVGGSSRWRRRAKRLRPRVSQSAQRTASDAYRTA